MNLESIGVIRTSFKEARGTPIQPTAARGVRGTVDVFERFARGLKDLEGFERIWLVYWFHRAAPARLLVRPYMDGEERGLFATRAPCRPNPIGISSVRLLAVEGRRLVVEDVDVLDGTPLLDLKPYVPAFDCYEASRCGWLDDACRRTDPSGKLADDRFEERGGR